MPLSDIIKENIVTVQSSATVKDAIALMRDEKVGAIVVVDKLNSDRGIPQGILTDRDIALFLGEEDSLGINSNICEVMTSHVILCTPEDGISETIEKMRINKVRRIPVVDDEDQLIGIVTSNDLFRLSGNEISSLSQAYSLRGETKDHSLRGNDRGEIANLLHQYS